MKPVRYDARNDRSARPHTPHVTIAVMIECEECGTEFEPSGRRRYCSDACRQAAYRRRHASPTVPARAPRADTVYECPDCETRYLGQQRCDECNLFCRAVGPGGECPHCGDAVALADLYTQQ